MIVTRNDSKQALKAAVGKPLDYWETLGGEYKADGDIEVWGPLVYPNTNREYKARVTMLAGVVAAVTILPKRGARVPA